MPKANWMREAKALGALIARAEADRRSTEPRNRTITETRRLLAGPLLEERNPTREIVPIQDELGVLLRRISHNLNGKDTTSISVDLAALWEVSRLHILLVAELIEKSDGVDEDRLIEIARQLFVNWFSNASDHMETLKKPLSRLAGFERAFYHKRSRRSTARKSARGDRIVTR